MVESNKPVNSTNNSQVWEGMAIGAGAGAGITGMTMGAAYGKHRFNDSRRSAVHDKYRDAMESHFVNDGISNEEYLRSQKVRGSAALGDADFKSFQGRTIHSRMGGGWKRAGIIAGMSALGAGAGAGIGYYNQKN